MEKRGKEEPYHVLMRMRNAHGKKENIARGNRDYSAVKANSQNLIIGKLGPTGGQGAKNSDTRKDL